MSDAGDLQVTHPDRVIFPDAGITKGELVEYYQKIAPTMLPHIRGRAVTLRRFPEGLDAEGFYQQERADYFPDYVGAVTLQRRDGGSVDHILCDDERALGYLANQGCITFHTWQSRADEPDLPDRLVFDLDPSTDDFSEIVAAARALRRVLNELDMTAGVMTSGSRGLHVVTPLTPDTSFDDARDFARRIAELVAQREPERFTIEHRKNKRGDRVFIDYLRNAYGQTSVAPYSVRARPGAPVAAPLQWDELGDSDLNARSYTIQNIFRRLGHKQDPWSNLQRHARSIAKRREKLDRLLKE